MKYIYQGSGLIAVKIDKTHEIKTIKFCVNNSFIFFKIKNLIYYTLLI